jgi:hypothetical protein
MYIRREIICNTWLAARDAIKERANTQIEECVFSGVWIKVKWYVSVKIRNNIKDNIEDNVWSNAEAVVKSSSCKESQLEAAYRAMERI